MNFLGMITEDFLDGCARVGVQEDLDFRAYAAEDGLDYLSVDDDYEFDFDGLVFDDYRDGCDDGEDWEY